ncbi:MULTISPECIES: acylneuraminate cytidylyltransferase family protein [Sulfurimonas]|uniref:acylneuraminate cytidylyltransferase family protein n=1 Tax=Sulfurimonas TaxID=202746 RepID=UPI0012650829|nr:acylneuraminate cytidylyltransferase family protein [Sulfurimonas indica]
MLDGKTFLAVIPARGGSKRLPRKNILPLAGKPLITWSIEAAKKSRYLDEVVVSSDDNEILSIAKQNALQVIKRPDRLANDTASSIDVIKHTLNIFSSYDYVVLLQPTSPLREKKHIDEAIELLVQQEADAVISVCEVEHSPLWSNTLGENNSMSGFLDQKLLNLRSQELKQYYRLNGAIYIAKTELLLTQDTFFLEKNIYAYIMPQKESVDIDTQLDFDFATFLIQGK